MSRLQRPSRKDVLYAALNHGWFTFPTDSKEQGDVFHVDPVRAPFDFTHNVEAWQPWRNSGDAFNLMVICKLNVEISDHFVSVLRDDIQLNSPYDKRTGADNVARQLIFQAAVILGKRLPIPECMAAYMQESEDEAK